VSGCAQGAQQALWGGILGAGQDLQARGAALWELWAGWYVLSWGVPRRCEEEGGGEAGVTARASQDLQAGGATVGRVLVGRCAQGITAGFVGRILGASQDFQAGGATAAGCFWV
jgi:hypothetical protein